MLTTLLTCTQRLPRRYLCLCERALCAVGNELVLVSVQQGVYLQAIGELMKEFPCCPAAKKNRGSGKAGTRQAARGPAPLGGLHEEHVLHNHRKKSCSSTAGKPRAILTRGHPSVQTSLSTKGHPHRPPGNRHLGASTGPTTVFSWTFTCKGKATLRSSSEYRLQLRKFPGPAQSAQIPPIVRKSRFGLAQGKILHLI